jgi:hypothetical protein
VAYLYTFSTASTSPLTSVTMTVPAGTTAAPVVGAVTPATLAVGANVTLVGTTVTYAFASTLVAAGTPVSITLTGFTNTATSGSYAAQLATLSGGTTIDTGVTPTVLLTGLLTLTSPSVLSWGSTLTGSPISVVDASTGDQQFTVNDSTETAAGWNVTVSATTFTNGTHTLPDSGTLATNGSLSAMTSMLAPSATCVTTCTLPGDTVAYPVAITTAASPASFEIWDTPAGGGAHAVIIGGHSAADPLGWWVNIPANAYAGAYTSTITIAVVAGP